MQNEDKKLEANRAVSGLVDRLVRLRGASNAE